MKKMKILEIYGEIERARTASQAAGSAAWGQTWEIRIPVCSAIDSAEVNLVWERELEVKCTITLPG